MTTRKVKRRHPGRNAALVLLLAMVLGVWALSGTLLTVQSVAVEGNNYRTREEVIVQSGLRMGQSMLTLNATAIKNAIEQDRYLVFKGLYRNYPNHVILRVSEVMPIATLTWLGMMVMFDTEGTVLEQTTQLDLELDIPVVTGVQVDQLSLGAEIKTKNPLQLHEMLKVLSELVYQRAIAEISELNVTDLDNMYLITRDGLQVQIGDGENLRAKIQVMRAGLPGARKMGIPGGGVLDVTSGVSADYQLPKTYHTPTPTAVPSTTPVPQP